MIGLLDRNPAVFLLIYFIVAFGGIAGMAALGTWTGDQLYPEAPNYSQMCKDRGGEFYFKSGACRVGEEWVKL